MIVMFASVLNQKRLLSSDEDLFSLIQLMLPVNLDRMQELFDPAAEWNLRSRNSPEAFKLIQRNRRRLAIQYASHMYRNAHILQRLGYAGIRSGRLDRVLKGKMVVDAGVPVRLRSALLLVFLRFQQMVYTGSNLSCVRDVVKDLLPEYGDMLRAASNLSQDLDPKLHENLTGVL
jgi:hypothetical protein